MLLKIKTFLFKLLYGSKIYVTVDATDNSITLSPRLVKYIKDVMNLRTARILTHKVSDKGIYAFTINPETEQPTQIDDLQYNPKYKTFGFWCHQANKILYDYNLPAGVKCRLSVNIVIKPFGTYFEICKPV